MKVEDVRSGHMFNANDLFVEMYMGFNEPVKTRVHNNAGSSCVFKETRATGAAAPARGRVLSHRSYSIYLYTYG